MTSRMQSEGSSPEATKKVRLADYRVALHTDISLLLALLIIPTPSGVSLIA